MMGKKLRSGPLKKTEAKKTEAGCKVKQGKLKSKHLRGGSPTAVETLSSSEELADISDLLYIQKGHEYVVYS